VYTWLEGWFEDVFLFILLLFVVHIILWMVASCEGKITKRSPAFFCFFFAKRGKNQLKEAEEKRCTIFLKSLNEQCWKHTLPPPHMRGLDGKQMY